MFLCAGFLDGLLPISVKSDSCDRGTKISRFKCTSVLSNSEALPCLIPPEVRTQIYKGARFSYDI